MPNTNKLNRLLLLSLTMISLLSGQEMQPAVSPITLTQLLGVNAIRTITIGDVAYAVGEDRGEPIHVILTRGVTKAFGIANGKLAPEMCNSNAVNG